MRPSLPLRPDDGAGRKTIDAFTRNGLPAVPIVLGFVGHRDPKPGDLATLRHRLAEIFYQFRSAYRYTPLVLLSSLAEGADQIAARVALENDVFVRVPLPFPLDAYRQSTSFRSARGRNELAALLCEPGVEAFEVPLPENSVACGFDWRAVAGDRDDRNSSLRQACYANVGGYIVRHCHALIVLSDEDEDGPRLSSRTAEFARFKLHGIPPEHYPKSMDEPLGFRGERGPIYLVYTPRAGVHSGEPRLGPAAGRMRVRLPAAGNSHEELKRDQTLARGLSPWPRRVALYLLRREHNVSKHAAAELLQFRQTCQAVDDFNRDIVDTRKPQDLRGQLAKLDSDLPADLPEDHIHRVWLKRIAATRAAAGHLSRELQPGLENTQLWVLGIIGTGVAVFHFYAHPLSETEDHEPVWLVLFLCALFLAGVVVVSTWLRRLDARRLDYRALAEGLRVRRAWAVAGIGVSVADSYLGQMRSEITWARRALKDVCPPALVWSEHFDGLTAREQRDRIQAVQTGWVQDQIKQMKKSHKREETRSIWLRRAGICLAVLGWLWIPVLAAIGRSAAVDGAASRNSSRADPAARHQDAEAPREHAGKTTSVAHNQGQTEHLLALRRPLNRWLVVSGILVIGGGLCVAFRQHRAHEELAKQYERMHLVFENGRIELTRRLATGDIRGGQAVLLALGREAIAENAQWLMLRRARPVEFHLA
jgi:hypothetical protein